MLDMSSGRAPDSTVKFITVSLEATGSGPSWSSVIEAKNGNKIKWAWVVLDMRNLSQEDSRV